MNTIEKRQIKGKTKDILAIFGILAHFGPFCLGTLFAPLLIISKILFIFYKVVFLRALLCKEHQSKHAVRLFFVVHVVENI